MVAKLFRRKRLLFPPPHVARFDFVMHSGFGFTNQVKVGALGLVQHGVLELRSRLEPRPLRKIGLDVRILERTTMTSKNYATDQ